jgi:hypothetical protein
MILLDTNVVSEPWKPKPDPRAINVAQAYIAAIAAARGFSVASRDTGPFQTAGVRIINSWTVAT